MISHIEKEIKKKSFLSLSLPYNFTYLFLSFYAHTSKDFDIESYLKHIQSITSHKGLPCTPLHPLPPLFNPLELITHYSTLYYI